MKQLKQLILIFIAIAISSCVATKQYNELADKLGMCKEDNQKLSSQNVNLSTKITELTSEVSRLKNKNEELIKQNEELSYDKETDARKLGMLKEENNDLIKQLNKIKSGSSEEIKKLLEELETTRSNLNIREDKLREAELELQARNARLIELEKVLAQKDQAVKELKIKVSNALVGFNNEGLSVYEKNGKVYVSLEERLLFKTGKWNVDPKGQNALKKLSTILEQNPDINVMVEGHTDDVAMHGSGEVKDNWDLSVMRSTAVTKILLQDSKIDPKRIISAGRSEYLPIDPAKTAEVRQKNRRTEIILTPKLDELLKLIESN